MRVTIAIFALIGTMTAGCLQVQPQPPLPATTMSSWGPTGGFTLSSGPTACAGHATLIAGHTTVNDPCFTGIDNIVMCTDTSMAGRAMQPRRRLSRGFRSRERHDLIRPRQVISGAGTIAFA